MNSFTLLFKCWCHLLVQLNVRDVKAEQVSASSRKLELLHQRRQRQQAPSIFTTQSSTGRKEGPSKIIVAIDNHNDSDIKILQWGRKRNASNAHLKKIFKGCLAQFWQALFMPATSPFPHSLLGWEEFRGVQNYGCAGPGNHRTPSVESKTVQNSPKKPKSGNRPQFHQMVQDAQFKSQFQHFWGILGVYKWYRLFHSIESAISECPKLGTFGRNHQKCPTLGIQKCHFRWNEISDTTCSSCSSL